MLKWITKRLPGSTRTKINFYKNDLSFSKNIPLGIRLKMWKKGYYSSSYYLIGIREKGTKYFVSDLFNELTHPKNGKYSSILDNKLYLPYCLKDFPDLCPDYNYLISNGKIYTLSGEHDVTDIDLVSVKSMLRSRGKQVGKIIGKSGGKGIYFFENGKDGKILINNSPSDIEKAYRKIEKMNEMVMMDQIEPHPYNKKLNPTTVNTIRIITAWDPIKNEPFIMGGTHKIGKRSMFGIDNGSSGGLTAGLDFEKSLIGKIAIRKGSRVFFDEKHPDSGTRITGMELPHFDGIKRKLLEICRHLNFLKIIGWDILITDDSFKVIEMNSNPDLWAVQMYGPLLEDERNRRFFSQFVDKKSRKYFMR